MNIQTLRMAIALAVFVIVAPASAQHSYFGQANIAGVERGGLLLPPANCGRAINQQQAESLWGGYCTESCLFQESGIQGGGGGCGCGAGGGGGSFGYPAGGGCGSNGGGCLGGKGCGCKLHRALHGGGGHFGGGSASSCDSGACGGGKGCGCKLHRAIHGGGGHFGGGHFGGGSANSCDSGTCGGGKGCGCKLHQAIHGGGRHFGGGSNSCDSGTCGGGGYFGPSSAFGYNAGAYDGGDYFGASSSSCDSGTCGGGKRHGCKLHQAIHGGGGKGCGCKLHQAIHGGGGKGCGCKLHQAIHGGRGAGSCDSGSYGGGSCDSGTCGGGHHSCGCKLCKLKSMMSGCKLFGGCCKFKHSAQDCGSNGAYFDEAVGYEYGTSGMQSCVSCNSSNMGSFDMGAPSMMAPTAGPQSVLGNRMDISQPAQPMMQHVPSAPRMMQPNVGSIETMNGIFPSN